MATVAVTKATHRPGLTGQRTHTCPTSEVSRSHLKTESVGALSRLKELVAAKCGLRHLKALAFSCVLSYPTLSIRNFKVFKSHIL